MPSVGGMRSTRVFGARVLRNGKRLWEAPVELKQLKFAKTTNNGEHLSELLNDTRDGGEETTDFKEHTWPLSDAAPKQHVIGGDVEEVSVESKKVEHGVAVVDNVRRWGIVYTRKRKKLASSSSDSSTVVKRRRSSDNQMFGKQFFRKQWRKRIPLCDLAEVEQSNVGHVVAEGLPEALMIVSESSSTSQYLLTSFLCHVLRYMRKARLELHQIFAFLQSKSISSVYFSYGIQFHQGSNFAPGRGVCMIAVCRCFLPLFSVDFSGLPFCFMHLHSIMLFHSLWRSYLLGIYLISRDGKDGGTIESSCISTKGTGAFDVMVTSYSDCNQEVVASLPSVYADKLQSGSVYAAKLPSGKLRVRNGHINCKRSSLRSKRGRPPSVLGARKVNAPSLFSSRQNGFQLPVMTHHRELRSSALTSNTRSLKQVNSRNAESTSSYANILVMESDRCYRQEGAMIKLEMTTNRRWHLSIMMGGTRIYSLVPQKFMRPCTCNRFTQAIIWVADCGRKLEFPDRRDWLIFKDLYKQCSDRNVKVPAESFIPVPRVQEVPFSANSSIFERPASYIRVKDDELSRALERRTANYDMDSDDESWIMEFNSQKKNCELSDEVFEEIMDSFERGFHCNPDDYSRETGAPSICVNVEKRIIETVYSYWINKRKQKRTALVRVFQLYQPRRIQLFPKSILRKKRSFRQKPSEVGRGKQPSLLQALAAEQDAQYVQNATLKVEEARAAASRSEGLAVLKRQRAQQLMENADLATYKATMALRIAELAQIAESCGN